MDIKPICDNQRHLICVPYSIPNLHLMADRLGISRSWFHKNHYDIPKWRMEEIMNSVMVVRPRTILLIIKHTKQ